MLRGSARYLARKYTRWSSLCLASREIYLRCTRQNGEETRTILPPIENSPVSTSRWVPWTSRCELCDSSCSLHQEQDSEGRCSCFRSGSRSGRLHERA